MRCCELYELRRSSRSSSRSSMLISCREPDFLTRCLTLFRDPKVGIVQTPQHFVNPDPIQGNLSLNGIWPDEQRYFFDVLMASKDAWGAAFCCGTVVGDPLQTVDADRRISRRTRSRKIIS